jgi:peptidoglycan glycosyltransferase
MRPHLVKAVLAPDGRVRYAIQPAVERRALRETTVRLLAGMMQSAVESGTGQAAQIEGLQVAGKTGSAQTPLGDAHAWFIGFAPVQDPRVAVAVIVEHGGSGGAAAAPIARDIMEALLRS